MMIILKTETKYQGNLVVEYRPKRWRRKDKILSICCFNYKPFSNIWLLNFYAFYVDKIKLIDMKLTGSYRLKGKQWEWGYDKCNNYSSENRNKEKLINPGKARKWKKNQHRPPQQREKFEQAWYRKKE